MSAAVPRFIAFSGDPDRQAALLARLSGHAEAATIDAKGPRWSGVDGTPAGCIAASGDPEAFEAATGYPACLGFLLDFLCQQFDDPAEIAGAARDWLERVTPGADLSRVPSEILSVVLAELLGSAELKGRAPQVAEALTRVLDLHRRVVSGRMPARMDWAAARSAAILATDTVQGLGHTCGELAEAAAWDPLTSRNILVEVANRWGRVCGALASAATGWRPEDDARMEACYQRFREETLARGETIERTAFPPYLKAHEPELERRFLAQLARENAAFLGAGRDLLRRSLDCLAAASTPPRVTAA